MRCRADVEQCRLAMRAKQGRMARIARFGVDI